MNGFRKWLRYVLLAAATAAGDVLGRALAVGLVRISSVAVASIIGWVAASVN